MVRVFDVMSFMSFVKTSMDSSSLRDVHRLVMRQDNSYFFKFGALSTVLNFPISSSVNSMQLTRAKKTLKQNSRIFNDIFECEMFLFGCDEELWFERFFNQLLSFTAQSSAFVNVHVLNELIYSFSSQPTHKA